MRESLRKTKRWVVKLGTSTLTTPDGHFSNRQLDQIVSQVSALLHHGIQVILVSSGAIALGMDTLKWAKRPTILSKLQACAAIGQGKLMKAYETAFSGRGFHTAQILLTRDGVEDRERYVNARHTIETLLSLGVIPVVNENDTVATEEIRFGDNDVLAAQVARMAKAHLLVLLSDIDGFYLRDKTLIGQIYSPAELKVYAAHIHEKKNEKTAGGMATKLQAAGTAMRAGIPTVIANGRDLKVMARILKGEKVGSLFHPVKRRRKK